MNENNILNPKTLDLYYYLCQQQKEFFEKNKNTPSIISNSISHPKLLASLFLTSTQIDNLRKKYESQTVSTVLTQLDLQKTAFEKHGNKTQNLLFSRTSLEQSTRYSVAKIHSERFIKTKAKKIADLGCGIGVDTFALCETIESEQKNIDTTIIGYELDTPTYEIATYNLSHFPFAKTINENIENINFETEKFDAIYTDPARRKNGKRINNPNNWSPSLNNIYSWLAYCPNIGIKVAPGIEYKYLHESSETNWLSINNELVEASIWFGNLKNHIGKTATIIKTDKNNNITFKKTIICDNNPTQEAIKTQTTTLSLQPELYITEIDPAILRANGLHIIAQKLNAKLISENISYLISEKENENIDLQHLIKQWKIIDFCSLKPKKINELLKNHNIGSIEIKKRGTDITPEILRKSLKLKGTKKSTLFLTRYKEKHIAILCEEINTTS